MYFLFPRFVFVSYVVRYIEAHVVDCVLGKRAV